MIDDDGWVQDTYYDSRLNDEEDEREWREQFSTGEDADE